MNNNDQKLIYCFFWCFLQAIYCVKTVMKHSEMEKKHQIADLSPSRTGKKAAINGPVAKRIIDPIPIPIKAGKTNIPMKCNETDGNG